MLLLVGSVRIELNCRTSPTSVREVPVGTGKPLIHTSELVSEPLVSYLTPPKLLFL